jgi:hypothetical protein
MPPPTNTFTVTIADAHSHSVAQSGVAGSTKLDAALSVLQNAVEQPTAYAGFTTTDTWTITVTQP